MTKTGIILRGPQRLVGPAACLAVGLLAACASGTFQRDVGYAKPAMSDIASIEALLGTTASGKSIVAWFEGTKAGALAAARKYAAGAGLTVADVKAGCAADQTAHSLISAAEWIVTLPSQAVKADELGYAAIQGACKLATAGTLPSAADAGQVVGMFNDVAVSLGVKK